MRLIASIERVVIISGFLLLLSFVAYAHRHRTIIDCIEYARHVLANDDGHIHAAFFVPDDPVKTIMLGLINNEQKSIKTAQFRVIDKDIAQALLDAYLLRHVIIEIITDHSCLLDQYEKVSWLASQGIPIHKYMNGSTLMHNKFWIFGHNFFNGPVLVTGSANATRSGFTKNEENIIVTNNPVIIERYETKFDTLFKKTFPVTPVRENYNIQDEQMYHRSIRLLNKHLDQIIRILR